MSTPKPKTHGFDTLSLHAGARPDPATGARATPIYQSASFVFPDSDHAAALFNMERAGHVYSRLSNPTNAVLEERIAALEGGVGAIATASGQAALHLAIVTLMGAGGHIVASRALYGPFLEAGIEIHEYHKSFLHAKVAVVDRRWATVGSSNIDPFSLLLAREANVVIDDPAFAEGLHQSLVREMEQGATQLKSERWTKEPFPLRAATWISYGVARFLTGTFAYGRKEEFA